MGDSASKLFVHSPSISTSQQTRVLVSFNWFFFSADFLSVGLVVASFWWCFNATRRSFALAFTGSSSAPGYRQLSRRR
jgi:hypothetical protein